MGTQDPYLDLWNIGLLGGQAFTSVVWTAVGIKPKSEITIFFQSEEHRDSHEGDIERILSILESLGLVVHREDTSESIRHIPLDSNVEEVIPQINVHFTIARDPALIEDSEEEHDSFLMRLPIISGIYFDVVAGKGYGFPETAIWGYALDLQFNRSREERLFREYLSPKQYAVWHEVSCFMCSCFNWREEVQEIRRWLDVLEETVPWIIDEIYDSYLKGPVWQHFKNGSRAVYRKR